MVGDQTGDKRAVGRGEENPLLDLEVVGEFDFIAIDGFAGEFGHVFGGGVGGERALREHAQGESVVVLMRKRDQTRVAEHRNLSRRAMAGSSTEESAA